MNPQTINEIVTQITAFNKGAYPKAELLQEYFLLQQQMVNLTFNESHADRSRLRLLDVEHHLERLNEERGHVADAELQKFEQECKEFCNLIKAEISGNKGETLAFRTLEGVRSKKIIVKNIEFNSGGGKNGAGRCGSYRPGGVSD